MGVAITRDVGVGIVGCELTHLSRSPIDVAVVRREHAAYRDRLVSLGWTVVRLPARDDLPDSVFVEDAAVVFDEVGVLTRPGAASRRAEPGLLAPMLARFRTLRTIDAPGTLDGGDVLVAGRRVWVGRTSRTNDAGIAALASIVEPLGYTVTPVDVTGCLHLKSAATAVDDDTVLVNPAWVDGSVFAPCAVVEVDPSEPGAANVLRVGAGAVAVASAFPATRARLEARGVVCHALEAGEIAKAEGALTCCSVLING